MKLTRDDIPQRIRVSDSSGLHCRWSDLDWFLFEGSTLTGLDGEPPDLSPDFQRGRVWTEDQQRAYVEYRLEGGYGSDLLRFNRTHPNAPSVIVDGLQRLSTVRSFLRDEFSVFLGLNGRDEGWRASQFDDRALWKNRDGAAFRIVVNELASRADVLRWYLELNEGGTPHSPNEIDRVRGLLQEEIRAESRIM